MEANISPNKPNPFTTVTTFSKVVALIIFIILPFTGFYLGMRYQEVTGTPGRTAELQVPKSVASESAKVVNTELTIGVKDTSGNRYLTKKSSGKPDYPGSSTYELWKYDPLDRGSAIYSITNINGFNFQISGDGQFIAVLNFGESMGDEVLTIIKNNGQVVKVFSDLQHNQHLEVVGWAGHNYWLSEGEPRPIAAIRIDADTLGVKRFGASK